MSGRLNLGATPGSTSLKGRARALLVLAGALGLGGVLAVVAQSATPPEFAAQASIAPSLYYIGDSAGSDYVFTVKNTGTNKGIGGVEITRPSGSWTIIGCTSPPGWSAQQSATKCRFRSSNSSFGIEPQGDQRQFTVKARTAYGNVNIVGSWPVVVSRSAHFDQPSLLKFASATGHGLTTRAQTFQLTTAVVTNGPLVPGAACPPANKEALVGSTKTIVVCGRNRANVVLTPTSAHSSLSGTFVKTPGTFSSGPIPAGHANSPSLVLAQWNATAVTDVFGSGKKVITQIGARADRTSHLRTFTGYFATSSPPVAVDDPSYATNEDTPLVVSVPANGVLGNDTDAESDPLTAVDHTNPSNGTLAFNADGTFTYTPNANFNGTDTFTYKAFDTHTKSSAATVTIAVNAVNDLPVGTDDTANVPEDSTGTSVDVLGNDTDVDGDPLTVSAVDDTGTTGVVTFSGSGVTYDPDGQFESLGDGQTATDTFTYTVSDGAGGTDTQTVTITIVGDNDDPVAVDNAYSTDEATSVGPLSILGNDTDAEGAVTLTSVSATTSGGTVTNHGDGTVTFNPNGAFEDLGNGQSRNTTFTYTITDAQGATDTATVTVTVNGINDAPDAVNDSPSVAEDSTGTTLNVLGNDLDAESQALTVTSVNVSGTTGQVTNNGTDITYDPNGQFESLGDGQTATDTFTYTITDSQGATDTATVTVTIQGDNDDPVANDDAYSTDEATQIGPLTVLINDTDAEGGVTLTAVSATSNGGTVTNNGDGTVTFHPNGAFEDLGNGQSRNTTFTYTVKDAQDVTDTATVTVTVNGINDAPDAVNDGPSVAEDSTGTTVNVLGNDLDAESQTLTVTSVNVSGTTGQVTNNGTDITYDPNGQFEYLGDGQTATDTFTYTITDSQGATDTATVTVTIQGDNDDPVANDDAYSTDEATQIGPLTVLINDTDAEGGVTITSIGATSNGGTVTNNNDGTVTLNPNGAFEDLGNGQSRNTTFTYTVTDAQGATDTATVTVTVNGINDAPVGNDDGPSVAEDSTGTTVNVLGNDTDAESQTLTVSLVDVTGTTGQVTNNGTDVTYDPNGQFEYLGDGQTATDTFTYTVQDSQGATDTATVTVTIQGDNDDPVANDDAYSTDEATQIGPLTVLINDTDAEGGVTLTAVSATSNGGTVTNNGDGTVTFNPNGAFEDLATGQSDTTTFTYTVTDAQSVTDTATVTITVNGINDAPVGNDDAASIGENASPGTVNVLGNDTDAESQTLTVSAVGSPSNGGTVTNNGTDVTFDPDGDFEGLDAGETAQSTFTYTVQDSQGATDTATVTITVNGANDAPVAVDDAYQTVQGNALVVAAPGVLGNDTDADVETLTASNASDPAHGDVTLMADGSFTYTPETLYLGPDSFTYDVSDGTSTDTATVNINVVSPNATPTADLTSASGNEDGGAITVTLTGHDADDDDLTFAPGSATSGTVGTPGTVDCTTTANTCTTTVTYTPNANFFGSDSFTYTVNDGTVDSAPATASITVNAVNDAPSFTKGADQTVNEDPGTQTVTGWATSISPGPNESGQTVSFVVTNSDNGLFTVGGQPAVSPTGDLTYTPALDANGSATVNVKIQDDAGTANGGADESAVQVFTITVNPVNDVPSFTKGADQTLFEDAGAQSVSNWASAISKGPADESGQTLSFTVTNTNNALFTTPGQPAVSPTGTLTFTSAPNAVGSATVSVSLSDDGGIANGGDDTSDVQTFTITVNGVNDEPSLTHDGDQTVLEDAGAQTVSGFVNSTSPGPADESGQTVTVAVTGQTNATLFSALPTIDAAGTLTYTPALNANGSSTVTVRATDDGGTANGGDDTGPDMTFTITVTAVNDEPSFTKGADQTLNEDAGAQSVSNWASAISKGPADESGQTLTFAVTNNNNGLFTVGGQPAVSPTGTLTYTSAANQYGSATVDVTLSDNGGTANGGDDTSPTQSFTITVNPVNDAPVAAAKAFTVQANMKISLGGLLVGATDPNDSPVPAGQPAYTPSFTLGAVTVGGGCVGCTVSNVNNAAGTFDFDPPPGGTGTYTAAYTVVDSGYPAPGVESAPQTITFTVNGPVVWFVDEDKGTAGTGRLSDPFNELSLATAAMASNSNHRIHVEDGNSTGNVTLQTDGWLISDTITQASFDTVMGITPPAGTIARPSNPGAPQRTLTGTVTLGDNSVVRGFNLTPTSGNRGLVGSGADGVTVNTMSITATNHRAVDLLNSSGTISLTAVNANGGDRGISLDGVNTSSGSFTVTGTGGAGSGGTVQNHTSAGATGAGIYLNNSKSISLDRMVVQNNTGSGVYGATVTTFSLANSTVSNNGTSVADDHSGINFDNLLGTSSLTGLTVFGSEEHNIIVENTTGTANLTVSNSTIRDNTPVTGGNGLYVNSSPAGAANAVINLTASNNAIERNRITGLQLFSQGSGKMTSTISGGTYLHNGQGLDIASQGTGGHAFSVTGGTVTGCVSCIQTSSPGVFADVGVGVNVFKGSLASGTGANALAGTITGMTVNQGGSTNAPGIWVHGGGGPGEVRAAITNNNVSNVGFNAIWVNGGNNPSGSQTWHATITGNTVSTTSGSFAEAIHVQSGTNSTDTTFTCAHIANNTASSPDLGDIRVWSRFAGTTLRLPGYGGTATDTTAVQNFLKAQNTIVDATAAISSSGPGFAGGAACTAP